ncbi:MAG: SAM-dependent methyltransferase [Prochlorothrix sp.]|nr:methyltransferase domain-containing protein [Prochlorothrix sp.]
MSTATPNPALSEVVQVAQSYYDSHDADTFYAEVWGGEDIHIGLYESETEPIAPASQRTIARLAETFGTLNASTHLLDLGSGYGGTARYLVKNFGCTVTALNLSSVENHRHRELNEKAGLSDRITVIDGNFESIPAADSSFDAVCSQDAILHSGQRAQVIAEVARVLKPGGRFVFTDPMQADTCPENVLEPILNRIHLDTLGSPQFYRQEAQKQGLVEVGFENLTHQLIRHYSRVLEETEARQAQLQEKISETYLENMKKGLRYWVEGGNNGYLAWGIFHFQKPA